MPRKTNGLLDPSSIAEELNAGKEVKVIPTFTHTFETKTGNVLTFEDCPVVLKCSQSGRFNPVAKVEEGAYVEDVTFVGRDRTASKTGFYRIDKQADKENQSTWRLKKAQQAENGEVAEEAGLVKDGKVVAEAVPAAKAPRTRKKAATKDAA